MNVIVSEVDGVPAAKIIDFGMGALTTRANLEGHEAIQGRVAGTPKFMSSEQRDPTCQLIGHSERHLFPRCRFAGTRGRGLTFGTLSPSESESGGIRRYPNGAATNIEY